MTPGQMVGPDTEKGTAEKHSSALAEARKRMIDLFGPIARTRKHQPARKASGSWKRWLIPTLMVMTFVWALVTSVEGFSSLLVLTHLDDYRTGTFVIASVQRSSDGEGSMIWGFHGSIFGEPQKLFAPQLADAKNLSIGQLERRFPPQSELPVWYNAEMTDTLFQGRTLRVIPYSEDLKQSELNRLEWWLGYCLLPFLLVLFWAWRTDPRYGKK
jgi:hypothetical protein